MAAHSNILAWGIPRTEEPEGYSPQSHKQSDTIERLTLSLSFTRCKDLQNYNTEDSEEFNHRQTKDHKKTDLSISVNMIHISQRWLCITMQKSWYFSIHDVGTKLSVLMKK